MTTLTGLKILEKKMFRKSLNICLKALGKNILRKLTFICPKVTGKNIVKNSRLLSFEKIFLGKYLKYPD